MRISNAPRQMPNGAMDDNIWHQHSPLTKRLYSDERMALRGGENYPGGVEELTRAEAYRRAHEERKRAGRLPTAMH